MDPNYPLRSGGRVGFLEEEEDEDLAGYLSVDAVEDARPGEIDGANIRTEKPDDMEGDPEPPSAALEAGCEDEDEPIKGNLPGDDPVSLYLKEMALIPLLSAEEEVSLAQRIEAALAARGELAGLRGRGAERRRRELECIVEEGDLARDHLIRANTRLVVSIARKYLGRGLPLLDLIQEGNLGLMKAVEKFDYHRGFRFSTYATWWIRQGITRAIADQSRTIRMPVHLVERLHKVYKVFQELEQERGQTPNFTELAERLNQDCGKVRWLLEVAQPPLSLESPVGDEEDSELGMYVEDENAPNPIQIAYLEMLQSCLEEVLGTLTPREARVLRLRFGLGQDRPYTLEEVGQKFGLTRERIRQIEGAALRHLRHPCRARLLREYL